MRFRSGIRIHIYDYKENIQGFKVANGLDGFIIGLASAVCVVIRS
jgi:hypothetical protein